VTRATPTASTRGSLLAALVVVGLVILSLLVQRGPGRPPQRTRDTSRVIVVGSAEYASGLDPRGGLRP
jgi:hypothetical protein